MSLGCIAATTLAIRAQACFIAPLDLSFLFFCLSSNGWVLFIQPSLYRNRFLFIGSKQLILRAKTPAFQILAHCSNRHLNSKKLKHRLSHGFSCPQRKGEFELIRSMVSYGLLQALFLLGCQRSATYLAAALTEYNRFGATFFICLEHFACIGRMDPDNFTSFFLGPSGLTRPNYLIARLLLYLRFKFSCINLFHVNKYSILGFNIVYCFPG